MSFVVETECGIEKTFDSNEDATNGAATHLDICDECDESDVNIYNANAPEPDGGSGAVSSEPEPQGNADTAEVVEADDAIPEPSQLTSDPLDVISKNADQFTDNIKGTTTINRQGYAVLAERFGISVQADPITLPSETDFEYAEFEATATTEDGDTYTGFGSAHVDRMDGDDKRILGELAETRAMKRAAAWATGIGMTAMEELEGDKA